VFTRGEKSPDVHVGKTYRSLEPAALLTVSGAVEEIVEYSFSVVAAFAVRTFSFGDAMEVVIEYNIARAQLEKDGCMDLR
jgi:hypothetical protein